MATKKFGRIVALLLSALLLCAPACPAVSAAAGGPCRLSEDGNHVFRKWSYNDYEHWWVCAACGETLEKGSHTGDPCEVCGTILGIGCDHNFVYNPNGLRGWNTHEEICTKCHKTRTVDCTLSPDVQERGSCLLPWYCICGNVHAEAYWEHNWSAWETNGSTHTRHCTNPGCTVTETGTHEYLPTINCTDPVSCSICGMVNGPALHSSHNWSSWINTGSGTHYRYCMNGGCSARESESHNPAPNNDRTVATVCQDCGAVIEEALSGHHWGAWTANAAGGHSRSCLDEGCDAKQGALHTGGTATCNNPARCSDCGAYYGSKNPNNHAGGTEIRNAKPASVGKAGYTGDTVCLGCGAVLSEGKEIPALEAAHTHSYGTEYKSDSVRHWKECACGAKSAEAAHTFKDGVCTVCGAADPTYRAPKTDHKHTFKTNNQWEHNDKQHWRVCTSCGALVDTAEHEYTYSISYNETGHWFNCVCGESVFGEHNYDEETHICADCKMMDPEFAPEYPEWPEEPDPSTSPDPSESKDPTDPSESKDPTDPKPEESKDPNPGESKDPNPGESKDPTDPGKTDPSEPDPEKPGPTDPDEPYFVDVDTNVIGFESIQKAASIGLMSGVGGGKFAPESSLTRSQLAMVMYNMADRPEAENAGTFTDVPDGEWFSDAVNWANEVGLVAGTGNGKFSPTQNTDRETVAQLLYRYAGIKGLSQEYDDNALDGFEDADQIQPWALEAMKWAVSNGIFVPNEDGKLNPKDDATRAEVAIFSVAFLESTAAE